MRDLGTTFNEIKALCLVCRRFDAIVKPRVSSYISAFQSFRNDPDLLSNVRQLLTLFSSIQNEQLNMTTTVCIRSWYWLNGARVTIPFRDLPIIQYIFLNARMLVVFSLILPIMHPRILPKRVLRFGLRTFAKLRLYVPCKLKFNLPNVSCVMCVVCYIFGKMADCILDGKCRSTIRSG